jgi:hypothetical protein
VKDILSVPDEGYSELMKDILSVPDKGYFERT